MSEAKHSLKLKRGFEAVLFLLFACSSNLLFARSATGSASSKIYDMKWLDANRWRIPIYNDGRFGIDVTRNGGAAGGSWPQPLKNYYIFGAGIWFGCITATGETLVSCGYNPNSGASELVPVIKTHFRENYERDQDLRIYMFPQDWPPPKEKFVVGTTPDGKPIVFCPQDTLSIQDAWTCFSDHDSAKHDPGGKPIGIDIGMTCYVWNLPANRDIVFIRYDVRNVSGDTLRNCYIGVVLDGDVGWYRDDMMGMVVDRQGDTAVPRRYVLNEARTDTAFVDNLAWIYDYDNVESPSPYWERGTPGAVAYDFLQSPFALTDGRDNDGDGLRDWQEVCSLYIWSLPPPDTVLRDADIDGIPAWRDFSEIEQLGMTACKMFPIEEDPTTDGEQYLAMAGYTHYLTPPQHDPYDDVDEVAGDKRFLQSSGPFTLLPDSIATLTVAIIGAKYGEEEEPAIQRDTWELAKASVEAQRVYDNNWLLPAAPLVPNFWVVPGDKKVTVVWDNLPERVPDPYYRIASRARGGDPTYKKFDFEGYKVYKSTDGVEWSRIAICDAKNGIKWSDTTITWKVVGRDTIRVESVYVWSTDKGLFYSYEDTDVVNGMEYYYAVTAFDHNFSRGERLILEAGIRGKKAIPRREAVNFILPEAEIKQVRGDAKNTKARFSFPTPHPTAVLDTTFILSFISPVYDPVLRAPFYRAVVRFKGDTLPLTDTIRLLYDTLGRVRKYRLPYFCGLEPELAFELDSARVPFDARRIRLTGNYPPESLKVYVAYGELLWAFRGSDYRLVWDRTATGKLTLKVYDLTNDTPVPWTPCSLGPKVKDADGWSFQTTPFRVPSETLLPTHQLIYLPGGFVALRQGRPITRLMDMIQPGDTWYIPGNKEYGCALSYTEYEITTRASRFDVTKRRKLNVKVVPNPYIVTTQWEKTTLARKIQFINLPHRCKIRIYNMAGDLVKIIEHNSDGDGMKNEFGGTATWNLLNTHDQKIASGVYIFHVESDVGSQTGKFAVVY